MDTRKIRVAFSYIAYPVAMPRYFLEALERRDDVDLWVAGPFTGRSIPWMGGMHLPPSYVKQPDLSLPPGPSTSVIYSYIEKHLPWEPDIWIEGNAGLKTEGRPKISPYVVIGTDPHVLNYDLAREKADIFYSMQQPYMKPGDRWLPYGYDPIYHRKTEKSWDERDYDISLVGLPYPERRSFMEELSRRGYRIHLENGPAYEDAWDIYNSSRLGLNLSSRSDTTARVFELMAMGLPAVLNSVPDLVSMFNAGEDYATFHTPEEGYTVVEALLRDPDRAQEIAENGYKAVQEHSWDARMSQVLSESGVL